MIEIVLPKIDIKNWASRECYNCGGMMMLGLESGMYPFDDRIYRVRRVRTWKCFDCGEQCYPGEEVKRIEDAVRSKSEELA